VSTLRLLVPTGRLPETKPASVGRVGQWQGARLGFLDNGKPNAGPLLHLLDEALQHAVSTAPGLHVRRSPIAPASPAVLDQLGGHCQGVVIASAD